MDRKVTTGESSAGASSTGIGDQPERIPSTMIDLARTSGVFTDAKEAAKKGGDASRIGDAMSDLLRTIVDSPDAIEELARAQRRP